MAAAGSTGVRSRRVRPEPNWLRRWGGPPTPLQQDALELIDVLRTGVSTTAALGIWTRKDIPLHAEWASGLPEGVVRALTDQAALDRWASEETGGLIDKFPLDDHARHRLGARLRARGSGQVASNRLTATRGTDIGSRLTLDQQRLSRTTYDLTEAAVLDGTVTRVVVEGDGDVDVHLLIGGQPAEVLAAGLRELSGEAQVCLATDLDSDGPGLTVRRVQSS